MKMRLAVAALVLGLQGCGGDHQSGITGLTFEAFRSQLASDAGSSAVDCGDVAIGADRSQANCCVVAAFNQSQAAIATYHEQGVDSYVVTGVLTRGGNAATYYHFDSDVTGQGGSQNGSVTENQCSNPIPRPNACSDPSGLPFTCIPPAS